MALADIQAYGRKKTPTSKEGLSQGNIQKPDASGLEHAHSEIIAENEEKPEDNEEGSKKKEIKRGLPIDGVRTSHQTRFVFLNLRILS